MQEVEIFRVFFMAFYLQKRFLGCGVGLFVLKIALIIMRDIYILFF